MVTSGRKGSRQAVGLLIKGDRPRLNPRSGVGTAIPILPRPNGRDCLQRGSTGFGFADHRHRADDSDVEIAEQQI
jgi:hypothetical protein